MREASIHLDALGMPVTYTEDCGHVPRSEDSRDIPNLLSSLLDQIRVCCGDRNEKSRNKV